MLIILREMKQKKMQITTIVDHPVKIEIKPKINV